MCALTRAIGGILHASYRSRWAFPKLRSSISREFLTLTSGHTCDRSGGWKWRGSVRCRAPCCYASSVFETAARSCPANQSKVASMTGFALGYTTWTKIRSRVRAQRGEDYSFALPPSTVRAASIKRLRSSPLLLNYRCHWRRSLRFCPAASFQAASSTIAAP